MTRVELHLADATRTVHVVVEDDAPAETVSAAAHYGALEALRWGQDTDQGHEDGDGAQEPTDPPVLPLADRVAMSATQAAVTRAAANGRAR